MDANYNLANVGRDWDLGVKIEVLKEQRRHAKDGRRFKIAVGVLFAIATGAAGLGLYGMNSGDFSPASAFWGAVGPILGTIIGYYFGKDGDDP